MNRTSRFLVEALNAMVLVSFGGGFIPTASACVGDACRCCQSVTGSGSKYTINNSDPHIPISVTACTVPSKNAATNSESACVSGTKFTRIIAPNGSSPGPPVANGMGLIVLKADMLWDPKRIIFEGCTAAQLNTARGISCNQKIQVIQNPQPGHHYEHVMRCKGEVIECCLKDDANASYQQCEATVVYPKDPNPPKVDVVCENLKSEMGVWAADLPFKQNPDKIHCTLTFTCGSPPADKLSADERKCTAVSSPAKTVTKEGNCVGNNCTSCDAVLVTPNDPCKVTFRGSKP
jgi:hypothetical protein